MILMLLLCGLVLGGAFGYKMFGQMMMMKYMASMGEKTQTVSTIVAQKSMWQDALKAVGTLTAVQGIDIAPEVAGKVKEIAFESGLDIEKGTPLVFLHDEEDRAALESLKAQLALAEQSLIRAKKQISSHAISQADYDAALANRDSLKAQVDSQCALVAKKTIYAPFAGRLGLRHVDPGEYVTAGTAIVTLQQLNPLHLDFSIPQQKLSLLQVGQKVTIHTDAFPDQNFEGTIIATDAQIDESTRNIKVRARVENPDMILRPGLFATLSLEVGQAQEYITLPQTSITFNPYGSVVYTVQKGEDGNKKAHMTFVETGLGRGDQIAILNGIKEGDEVITAGQLKLRNGSPIVINNEIQPSNDPAPTPVDR
jgi:membrane fusion protein (multidrug efflux system)